MAYRDIQDLNPLTLRRTFLDQLETALGPGPFTRPPDPPEVSEATRDLEALAASLAAAEKRLLKRGVEVPQWMIEAGIPIKWSTYHQKWSIQLKVSSRVTEVLYRDVWIHRPTSPRPFTVKLWLPLEKDGGYRISTLSIADEKVALPHISGGMACLGLGDAPLKVTSQAELKSLNISLVRGLNQVNLSSLLSYQKMLWPKEVRMAIPGEARKHIGRRRMGQIPPAVLEKYFVRVEAEREGETWQMSPAGVRLP